MTPQQRLAKLALIYIERTKLEGAEVGTYIEVTNWLNAIANYQEPKNETSNEHGVGDVSQAG